MSSDSKQYPAWAYMLAGILIGLFISFLIYLRNLPVPVVPDGPVPSVKTDDAQDDAPTFDFYKILPELEVVIPDTEIKSTDKETQGAATQVEPEVGENEQLILQAGSFSQFEQADKLKASLALLGVEADIQGITVNNKRWHRVRIGPMTSRSELNKIKLRLQNNGIKTMTLRIKSK